jgi:hypothetical protein
MKQILQTVSICSFMTRRPMNRSNNLLQIWMLVILSRWTKCAFGSRWLRNVPACAAWRSGMPVKTTRLLLKENFGCTESSRLIACSRKTISLRNHTVNKWQIKMHATSCNKICGQTWQWFYFSSVRLQIQGWEFVPLVICQATHPTPFRCGRSQGPGRGKAGVPGSKAKTGPIEGMYIFLQQRVGKWIISDQYRSSLLECKGHAGHVLRILYKGCQRKSGPAALRRHQAFVMLHNDTHTTSYRIIQPKLVCWQILIFWSNMVQYRQYLSIMIPGARLWSHGCRLSMPARVGT